MVKNMFVQPLEFARGKDKKKRKKRTELGANIRAGAKLGALAGAGLYGASIIRNRKNVSSIMSDINKTAKYSGFSPKAAKRITRGITGAVLGKDAAKNAAKGALIGTSTLGVGTLAVRAARGQGAFGSLRNKNKDRKAEARVAKREKRKEAKYV
jgi:hypothetical protein